MVLTTKVTCFYRFLLSTSLSIPPIMVIFYQPSDILNSPYSPATTSQPLSYPATPAVVLGPQKASTEVFSPSKASGRSLIRLLTDLTTPRIRGQKTRCSRGSRALGLSSCGPFKNRTLSGPADLTDPSFNRNLTWTSPS